MFITLCVQKYFEATITYLNRVLRGRIIPNNINRLSLPFKFAYYSYLKTIRKCKRPAVKQGIKSTPKPLSKEQIKANATKIGARDAKPIEINIKRKANSAKVETQKTEPIESPTNQNATLVPKSQKRKQDLVKVESKQADIEKSTYNQVLYKFTPIQSTFTSDNAEPSKEVQLHIAELESKSQYRNNTIRDAELDFFKLLSEIECLELPPPSNL